MTKNCLRCGKTFQKKPTESATFWASRKYCGHSCANSVNMKGKKHGLGNLPNSHSFKKGHRPANWKGGPVQLTCQQCEQLFTVKPYRKEVAKFCSNLCRTNASNQGKTDEAKKIRMSKKYREWRETVFKRDNHTCQSCGVRGGVELNADHIFPFAHFPEQRFLVENGQTLCHDCHKKTPSFGKKGHKFSEFDFCPTYLLEA